MNGRSCCPFTGRCRTLMERSSPPEPTKHHMGRCFLLTGTTCCGKNFRNELLSLRLKPSKATGLRRNNHWGERWQRRRNTESIRWLTTFCPTPIHPGAPKRVRVRYTETKRHLPRTTQIGKCYGSPLKSIQPALMIKNWSMPPEIFFSIIWVSRRYPVSQTLPRPISAPPI